MSQYYKCPKCGSDDFGNGITGGDLEQDDGFVWKYYECDCGFSWQEVYQFLHNETTDGECNELDDKGNEI